ncbi:MAG: hypothetical protein L6R40_003663 [Gallowayella cf. fulva]|nr:MAG: hypothetical protein L6R40_003663 [Xanthomendoza cf. fulva]
MHITLLNSTLQSHYVSLRVICGVSLSLSFPLRYETLVSFLRSPSRTQMILHVAFVPLILGQHRKHSQSSNSTAHTPSSLSALSAFNTSTPTPPSDPPPAPPPLNLPPSRARRQFAARLALHSQQAQQIQQQAQADAVAAANEGTPAQEHAQDLGSPPGIEVTQHDDGSDSSDDGNVMMKTHSKPTATATAASGFTETSSSDEDAESEEMRFGGEGLEGFVHSPRDLQAEGSDGSDEGLEMGLGRMEGHEEDVGKSRRL